jgi:hypothetical protein
MIAVHRTVHGSVKNVVSTFEQFLAPKQDQRTARSGIPKGDAIPLGCAAGTMRSASK